MIFNLLTDLYTVDGHKPNFTIITPGPCNAKCGFCFWDAKDGKIKPPKNYIDLLVETIKSIPHSICPALSISGGEPTISPHFENILKVLDLLPRKWDRIVLTTNGSNLNKWLDNPIFRRVVTHINISRHHYEDAKNRDIFHSNLVPSVDHIQNMVKMHGGIYNFNINCVTSETTDSEFIYRMIVLANFDLNLHSISFRKEAGDVSPSPVEQEFVRKFGVVSSNNCPVCRTTIQENKNFKIMWKGSHPEPSQHLNKLYELVFHPNGKVYGDWSRKIEVNLKMEPETQEGKFWFNRWASLVREFESYKKVATIDTPKKIQGGCHSGGDDIIISKRHKPEKRVQEITRHSGGCGGGSGHSDACGGSRGCGGGCGG
jgi:MoaA/NifB/PqqE/SkfB family radical SAM enzyme